MSLTEACKEALYLYLQTVFLHYKYFAKIILYNGNQSALKLVVKRQNHKRAKHIDVRHNFIRMVIANDNIKTMPADVLTKGLCSAKYNRCIEQLGIVKVG